MQSKTASKTKPATKRSRSRSVHVLPAAAPAPTVFDSQVAFSPTYSSGYYYASPYSGYTSLSYYASIYTARRFGG